MYLMIMEEIRRTVSHKPDIHMELDDLLQAEHISSDKDEDLIKQIEHFCEQDEKCSGKINDRLAKIVNDGICIRINADKKKDLLTKHYKPENCEKFTSSKSKQRHLDFTGTKSTKQ